ncbi:hypothetical protein BMS3Abin04_02637 [bacterium BMS3Abin04]|nr:hypothetical protein BMS3Abin04_02637 [bacterium BMS3Abin04]
MTDKNLYCYAGIFDTPDQIINAAKKVQSDGYTKYDVNTPYPIHGMDSAMDLKPSLLPYVALVVGFLGAASALFFMWWTNSVDYPLIIGGKPFFALPAYIPITFEITVLSASIMTVVTMLFVIFKFPNNSHPLHDTDYLKQVSVNKYGIVILADDPKFDESNIKQVFASLGASQVFPIFYHEEVINFKPRIFEPKFIWFLIILFVLVSGSTYITLNKLMFLPPYNWMMKQNKVIVQEKSEFFKNGKGMRMPVEGTVARGFLPYEFVNKPELAAKDLLNPLLPTKYNLELGKTKYNIYCSPCHGYHAEGDSRLRGQFPNPPSLHSEKVRSWSDGRIFHVITEGQNVMPSYSSQLSREERWAVILYVRALQRSLNAKESDLP